MNVDLHCHTNMSDGSVTPEQLVELANERALDILSITDHDTLDAYSAIKVIPPRLQLITGIEFSSQWRKQGIHIVGLHVDPLSESIIFGVAQQKKARLDRAEKIAERLSNLGFEHCLEGATLLADGQIGRPHFAQHLVNIGAVSNIKQAFKKYLGAGKVGDIKEQWAETATVVQWIRESGGIAVLAHPSKYKMTRTKLKELLTDFCSAGGEGMEVISGLQVPAVTRDLATLCNQYDLLASCGSDFHAPGMKWAALGLVSSLPDNCNPIWHRWA